MTDIILGIDPGTVVTGFGIIRDYTALDYGCIRPPREAPLHERYLILHESIKELIRKWNPSVLVVETQFVKLNVQSAIKLGMARGAVIVACGRDVPVFEYAPTSAKLAVTGTGRASKQQVQMMVQKLLGLSKIPQPEDAADALALALCHLIRSKQCTLI